MFLVRLIYASKVDDLFFPDDITSILNVARINNEQAGITGMLCFDPCYFLQCLEGSRSAVNRVFSVIQQDARHNSVEILSYREITKRAFEHWDMGYVPHKRMTRDIILRVNSEAVFNPFEISGEGALSLLQELREMAE